VIISVWRVLFAINDTQTVTGSHHNFATCLRKPLENGTSRKGSVVQQIPCVIRSDPNLIDITFSDTANTNRTLPKSGVAYYGQDGKDLSSLETTRRFA
jgi:hypothetical protein